MRYVQSTITYAGVVYLFSIVVLTAGPAINGEPIPQPNTPGVVDRADGWPESKAKHQKPGHLFTTLEKIHFPSAYTWFYENTEDYKTMELWVWCLLLPLFLGLMIGSVVARYRRASSVTSLSLGGLSLCLVIIAAGTEAMTFYDILWDLSIQWANMLGVTYYAFTVLTFITVPAIIMLGGCAWHVALLWRDR